MNLILQAIKTLFRKLGADINRAKTTADTAMTTADEAKTTADTALTTADTALTTADTAMTTADTAMTTADTALTTADEAKTTADKTLILNWKTITPVIQESNLLDTGGRFAEALANSKGQFYTCPDAIFGVYNTYTSREKYEKILNSANITLWENKTTNTNTAAGSYLNIADLYVKFYDKINDSSYFSDQGVFDFAVVYYSGFPILVLRDEKYSNINNCVRAYFYYKDEHNRVADFTYCTSYDKNQAALFASSNWRHVLTKGDSLPIVDSTNGFEYLIRMSNGSLTPICRTKSIAITTMPTKTSYVSGETLDLEGMVVTLTRQDGTTEIITNYSVDPTPNAILTASDINYRVATVFYTEAGIIYRATFKYTVAPSSTNQ